MKFSATMKGILVCCLLPTPAEITPNPRSWGLLLKAHKGAKGVTASLPRRIRAVPRSGLVACLDHFFEGQNPKTGALQNNVFAPAFALQKNVYPFPFHQKKEKPIFER